MQLALCKVIKSELVLQLGFPERDSIGWDSGLSSGYFNFLTMFSSLSSLTECLVVNVAAKRRDQSRKGGGDCPIIANFKSGAVLESLEGLFSIFIW